MNSQLDQIINTLNPAQRQAVDQIYGPVLVLAGPGTGKTHMLTTRVAAILGSGAGANAENILCLTFTENAAVEMRTRLQKWIGSEAYKVKISTFHGFCQWVMDENPAIFYPLIGEREVIDDLGKALTYRSVIKSKKWKYFSSVWDDFAFQYDVLKAVSDLKREQLNPDSFRGLIPAEKDRLELDPNNFYKRKFKDFQPGDWKPQARSKIDDKIAKMYELADLWELYEKALSESGYYDFDDLINWVVEALKTNKNLRLDLQERFQWILVDEYQDTNNSQNTILWQLTDGVSAPNLFAVGDDDQSIYRFQGASVANVQDFRARFTDRLEVTLTENYRSHQHILEAAYASVSNNLNRSNIDKILVARKTNFSSESPGKISQAELSGRMAEIAFLADEIKKHLASGVAPDEIAILVRKNREIQELATELPKLGVRVAAQVATDIFENERVRQLILMLEVFAEPTSSDKLFDLLHSDFLAIPPEVLLTISLYKKRDSTLIETLLQNKDVDPSLTKFINFYLETKRDFHQSRAAVITEKFLYESGLAEYLTTENLLNDWQAIRKFIAWVREQVQSDKFRKNFRFEKELPEILNRVDLHRSLGIKILPDRLPQDRDSIQIMTAHKSKGLEFEVVFVPGLEDRKWGNPRANKGLALPQLQDQDFDENEEERRLFFVALTRAKSQLYLSYPMTDFSGRDKAPSIFWHEVPENLSHKQVADDIEVKLQHLLPVFFAQAEKTLTSGEQAILLDRVKNFVWSASSLQTYLDCPRKFLYQNLYRFPRRPLPQLALGVSLHQALEQTFLQMKNGGGAKPYLLEAYESALRGQNLSYEEFEKFLPHGQEILANYYDQKLQNFSTDYPFGFELEYDFGSLKPMIEDIQITGTMDKIVYLDAKKSRVKIIDYKSGRPRPIVPGEAYWRQLVFYDLLARQSRGHLWQIDSAEIEFLTADTNGKLGSRSIEITSEDREKVIEELKTAHEKVMNLEFPMVDNLAGDKDIDYWQNFGQ